MKLLAVTIVTFIAHIAVFFIALLSANASITLVALCSASVWSYPLVWVAIWRISTGRAGVRFARLSENEYNAIMRKRTNES